MKFDSCTSMERNQDPVNELRQVFALLGNICGQRPFVLAPNLIGRMADPDLLSINWNGISYWCFLFLLGLS